VGGYSPCVVWDVEADLHGGWLAQGVVQRAVGGDGEERVAPLFGKCCRRGDVDGDVGDPVRCAAGAEFGFDAKAITSHVVPR
jgi:hypothetical protein